MIDSDGYRANVGIILCNDDGRLLWARRIGQNAWQFPQGGIKPHETRKEALFRELREEIGLQSCHVEIMGSTQGWLRYDLPKRFVRHGSTPLCIGQKQVWFLLRFIGNDDDVRLDLGERPEFDGWRWVDYWYPLKQVVPFKRDVYRQALQQLEPLIHPSKPARSHSVGH
jgi:putative (di)nucleoside polyphosphate hydrolase